MKVLAMNAGSSTMKLALYQLGDSDDVQKPEPLWASAADIQWQDLDADGQERAVATMFAGQNGGRMPVALGEIDVVGHRVVHGGNNYSAPVEIDAAVRKEIGELSKFAPVHNPVNLRGIVIAEKLLPEARHVAVFDTAFHSSMPPEAYIYPVPYSWYQEHGVRRYGFHGISHAYCSRRAAELLGRDPRDFKVVVCHLGNGCSLSAVANGSCVDTTMGFTPLEGLMMGCRSGSIDPGLLMYMLESGTMSLSELKKTLNYDSGLEGVSGVSQDMREVQAAMDSGNERAKLAFDVFVHRLRAAIAAMVASLGGLDALVFTAGIGENSVAVRKAVCAGLGFLSVELDGEKNKAVKGADVDVATAGSPVRVLVIHSREDLQIALEARSLVARAMHGIAPTG